MRNNGMVDALGLAVVFGAMVCRITSYNVCYTKLLRAPSGADAVRLVKSVPRYLRCTTYGGVSEDYTIILVAKWTYAAAPEYIVAPPSTYSCPYLRNIPPSYNFV